MVRYRVKGLFWNSCEGAGEGAFVLGLSSAAAGGSGALGVSSAVALMRVLLSSARFVRVDLLLWLLE